MKKWFILTMTLFWGVMSCSVYESESEIEGPIHVVFEAEPFQDGDGEEETKTNVGHNSDYSSYTFMWSEKDTVGIFPNKGSQIYFEMTSGSGASSAEFDGGAWECKTGYEYRSYYPFIGKIYLDATKIPVRFTGQKQVGNDNNDHFKVYDYMYTPVASSENGTIHFSFKHLITAILPMVELPAGHYTGIDLSLEEPLFVTVGLYDLTAASPSITGKSFAAALHIALDVTFSSPSQLVVYVPLAPMNIANKTVTVAVTEEGGGIFQYTYTPKKEFVAPNFYRLRSPVSFIPSTVSLDKTEATLLVGQTQQLTATVLPANAADKSVTWTSSNTDVATVDASGVVTAVAVGSATITATATQGGNTATCAVTVSPVEVTSVELNKTELTLNKGTSETLTATVLPANATDKTVTWSSSNTAIATVDATGKVTAVAGGSATVTATSGGKSATCAVTVTVPVSSVSLNKTSTDIYIGSTETLTATVAPSDASNKSVTWSSNNTSIATVDADGIVTAVAVGTATITVKTTDGNKTASCTVTVKPIEVTKVELNKSTLSLVKGNAETLTATVSPSNATNKAVTWTSSNTVVATVDANGKVTAVGGGSATITASAGGKSATCTVTVTVPVTGVSLNKSTTSIVIGNTETLTATVTPSDATNKAVTWTSSKTSVATVDANGKVTAVAVGDATITVKTSDGNKTATCTVTVSPIAITGISLNKSTLSLTKGSYETLTATITPENATYKTVTWGSSNNDVATVDANGKVTAIGGGTATITATAGGKSATCAVTVTVPVTGVSLNKATTEILVGGTETLTATVAPSDATNKSVTWTSNATSVATVSSTGVVTAVAVGTATITVKTADGNKTATCSVTVSPIAVTKVELNKTTLSLSKGSNETLTATVSPSNATDKTVTWTSNNTAVATVNSSGKVTAVGGGSATITASAGGKSATCAVTVTVPVTGVTLNKNTLSIVKGNTATLTATVSPSDATNKNVTWTSNATSVATVSSTGVVTAVAVGTATITVKTTDGNKTATCTVTVTPIKVSSITLNKTTASVNVGSTVTLTATVSPSNAADKTVAWSSSDETVATVSTSGVVTGIKAGTATITATAHDGSGVSKSCTVTVNNVAVTGVSLDKTSLSLSKGGTYTLTATVTPTNATDKTVTWSSTNSSVATVDQNGKVTAVGGGSATIKAKAGDITATCSVSVVIPVTSIKIYSQNKKAEVTSLSMYKGDSDELSVVCYPTDATNKAEYTTLSNQYWNYNYTYITGYAGSVYIDEDSATSTFSNVVTVAVKGLTASVSITVLDATPTPVNLGLSVNWASTNMYASSQTDAGRFFSWNDAKDRFTGAWRLPTKAEMQELLDNCNVKKETGGVRLTLKNDNTKSIFFPYTGFYINDVYYPASYPATSYLWSSTRDSYPDYVWKFQFDTNQNINVTSTDYSDAKKQKSPVRLVQINHINVSSVQLDQTSATVYKNRTLQLTATVSPANATDKSVTWSSSNTSIATVDENGLVTTKSTTGSATITATSNDGNKTATCAITVAAMPTATAVDLGLSVKWASFNVGASSESGYGEYYYWGDTLPLGAGGNCKWGSDECIYRYCTTSDDWEGEGDMDNKTSFADYNYVDDPARANWGSTWRTPTPTEIDELINGCTWESTTVNGIKGYRVTGKKSGYTSKSIFLPAGGEAGTSYVGTRGYYWSSTIYSSNSNNAYYLYIYVGSSPSKSKGTTDRESGFMIRPVKP